MLLLERLNTFTCLVVSLAFLAALLGHSKAQSNGDTITIDSSAFPLYDRTFVVPRVENLQFLLPLDTTASLEGTPLSTNCSTTTYCSVSVTTSPSSTSLQLELTRERIIKIFTIIIDDRYMAGCSNYLFPRNATLDTGVDTLDPLTLTCDPVSTNYTSSLNWSESTIVWRRFTAITDVQEFIDNCSRSCDSGCVNSTATRVTAGDSGYTLAGYDLTIMNPQDNRAWFVPTFEFTSCIYVGRETYLYRWPTITSHYEFSLEVQEMTTNYSSLQCQTESFPPITTIKWRREGQNIDSLSRYTFSDIVDGDQTTRNGIVTIDRVSSEDSALFTCEAIHNASQPGVANVTLNVRIRVKGRLRPLWPAVGIIGVGIIVSLFIIIGHFVDKAIEKHQTDPSNPAHHKRLQSITSATMENENPSNNTPSTHKTDHAPKLHLAGHSAVKRLSSAKVQLLEEPNP